MRVGCRYIQIESERIQDMSLTKDDLKHIATIVTEAIDTRVPAIVDERVTSIIDERVTHIVDSSIDSRVPALITTGVVQAIQELVIPQFDRIYDQLASMEARLDIIDRRLADIEARLDHVEDRLEKLGRELLTIRNERKELNTATQQIYAGKRSHESEIHILKLKLGQLQKKVEILENSVNSVSN